MNRQRMDTLTSPDLMCGSLGCCTMILHQSHMWQAHVTEQV